MFPGRWATYVCLWTSTPVCICKNKPYDVEMYLLLPPPPFVDAFFAGTDIIEFVIVPVVPVE